MKFLVLFMFIPLQFLPLWAVAVPIPTSILFNKLNYFAWAIDKVPIPIPIAIGTIGRTHDLFLTNQTKHYVWAVDEDWTHDLFLTKEVLYHWATTAFLPLIVIRYPLIERTING